MYNIYTYICFKCIQFLKINAGNSLSAPMKDHQAAPHKDMGEGLGGELSLNGTQSTCRNIVPLIR